MDCTITIKGTGSSNHGRLKNDWTGTIKEAIKDWDIFYRAVFNHVKACEKCDVNEVLRAYWTLRQKPKHKGKSSTGLAALAARYLRIGADVDLVKRFIVNTHSPDDTIRYAHVFEDEELYDIICQRIREEINRRGGDWPYDSAAREIHRLSERKRRPILRAAAQVFEAHIMPPYEDVERLAVVAEVTTS